MEEADGHRRCRTNRRGSRLGRGVQRTLQSRCHDDVLQLWHSEIASEESEKMSAAAARTNCLTSSHEVQMSIERAHQNLAACELPKR